MRNKITIKFEEFKMKMNEITKSFCLISIKMLKTMCDKDTGKSNKYAWKTMKQLQKHSRVAVL